MKINLSSSPRVAVLGAAALDWVARVKEMPCVDGIVYADDYTNMPGGTGGNVAEGVARLGHGVRFLGAMGDDLSGQILMKAFVEAGVDTHCIQIQKNQRSASCFVAIDEHGDRMIFSLGGVALYTKAEDVRPAWLSGVEVLVIADAYPEVALRAISYLDEGATVVFNPGGLMIYNGDEYLDPICKKADVLIASRVEAEAMTGLSKPEKAIAKLSKRGPGVVMVTQGHLGALTLDHGELIQTAPFPVKNVIDTTGAGDAFTSGVIAGIMEGLSWEETTRLGCAVASIKVGRYGARGGLPDRWQVQKILEETSR